MEPQVIDVVAKLRNLESVEKFGLVLDSRYPHFGASPDAVSEEYVIEVKCPTSAHTKTHYVKTNGNVTEKVLAQVHLQMLLCRKMKALLCVASPDFETSREVQVVEIDYFPQFIHEMIRKADDFWKTFIFPKLVSFVRKDI